jgi:hypothetical protein
VSVQRYEPSTSRITTILLEEIPLFEQLSVAQLVKTLRALYGTQVSLARSEAPATEHCSR